MDMIIVLAAGLLLVRLGQTLYFSGSARSKNAAGAAMRVLCDLCVATLAFWALGSAILLQNSNPVFCIEPRLLLGWRGASESVFFGLAVVLAGTGVVSGSMGERTRFFTLCGASAVVAAIAIPVALHWSWRGWLGRIGFADVAGASAIHATAGAFALVGAIVVGARTGKYNRDGSASMIPGHNVPLAVAGVVTLVIGFVWYVVACTQAHNFSHMRIAQSAMNVLLSAAAGGAAAMLLGRLRYGKADIGLSLLGVMGGLVAITAAGGAIGSPAAVVTGAVAGLLVPLASIILDLFARVDDPGGGVSVHLVGGLWGTISAGLFMPGGFTDRLAHFGVQLLGAVVILALAVGLALATFLTLRATVGVRSKEADEYDGLDLAEHDIGAYPDFQQTMIKSYHLREA